MGESSEEQDQAVIGLALFWLFGLVWVVFPNTGLRFFLWFHGPALAARKPQQEAWRHRFDLSKDSAVRDGHCRP